MRRELGSWIVLVGLVAPLAVAAGLGCASEDAPIPLDDEGPGGGDGTGPGSGGSGGSAGAGGFACVPETETCDGLDNDCDDEVDEGCACSEGDTQTCYTGPRGTQDIGACKAGTQTCSASGVWGACRGEVTPSSESCNGIDDDCNGMIDELGDQTCGVGACAVTVPVCANGQPIACTPGNPTVETCDGIDNDCDQVVDESFVGKGEACSTGQQGICDLGTLDCLGGKIVCVPDQSAVGETCNGTDDDCNGTVDDNIPGTGGKCSTGLPGPCAAGTVSCQGGVVDCFPDVPPVAEICDGVDNDCDGIVDQGDPESGATCDTGLPGVCQSGVEHCMAGAIQCVPEQTGSPETCNGSDDDCDGTIDEGNPGGGQQCGCGGTTFCIGGAVQCVGGPTVYFEDSFNGGNSKGWTLGTEWAIGPAASGCADPDTDHTAATSDNNVAGVVLGGCYDDTATHPYYYLESPAFDTSAAQQVYLEFWRWLQSDYTPYVQNAVEVFDGSTWNTIWQSGPSPGISDTAWVKQQFDITLYKNAQMKIRWGHTVMSTAAFADGGWNIDDVKVTSSPCP